MGEEWLRGTVVERPTVTVSVLATVAIWEGNGVRQLQALEMRLGRYGATYAGTEPVRVMVGAGCGVGYVIGDGKGVCSS